MILEGIFPLSFPAERKQVNKNGFSIDRDWIAQMVFIYAKKRVLSVNLLT
jgi:hypothetical protein